MKCEIRIVSGARAGQRDVFEKSYLGIGRHPLSDVRFDAAKDLDASTRHAAIVRTGDAFVLRDLGSTNGTFVNGQKVEADQTLKDGDVIRCGLHGPEIEFRMVREQEEVVIPVVHAPQPASPQPGSAAPPTATAAGPPRATPDRPAAPAPRPSPAGASATAVLRAQIREQASRFRALTVMLMIVMLGAAGVLVWQGRTASTERQHFGSVLDSLSREVAQLRRLQAAADSQAAHLRTRMASERDPGRREVLRRQLDSTERRRVTIVQAQSVNWSSITGTNRRAVAIIYVQFPDSTMWTGTAFCVTSGGLMITNRHVITSERGERPARIAIQFSGSGEVLPARIERVAPDADLAVIRLESAGPFATVAGLGSGPVSEGDPIGLIGFPLGVDLPQGSAPTASLFTGSVSRVISDSLLQLDAFSGTGASGSPIFDRNGRVIGVEFGGIRETGGRVILGLPIRRAMALLPS